ncbi:MAG: 2-dehydropantoate 2-reductase [Desulfobacterales bacterium]|nr:2-dehydropantoate 2-reductase [Desulfobacterales bacterium]
MSSIRHIHIVGAGAMGAAYAALFAAAPDFRVAFVARGERHRRLAHQTLKVNGRSYDIPVIHPDKVAQRADLVLVALKHHHLKAALEDINALVGEDTVILSVMNGLESEAAIGALCGHQGLVYAVAVGIDAVRQGDRFVFGSPGRIIFGRDPLVPGDPVVARLREALTRAAIPHEVPADIRRVMWWKFMINVGVNQASAVLGAPYGVFQTSPDARALMVALMQEVISLAEKNDIGLDTADIDAWLDILATLSPEGKTSMLQDIEAGRKTEVELFAGHVVALGAKHQVSTPVNATILKVIKVLEQNSRGFT